MTLLSRRHALIAGGASMLAPGLARAQAAWPTQPVSFVVGYAAGGGADIMARCSPSGPMAQNWGCDLRRIWVSSE